MTAAHGDHSDSASPPSSTATVKYKETTTIDSSSGGNITALAEIARRLSIAIEELNNSKQAPPSH